MEQLAVLSRPLTQRFQSRLRCPDRIDLFRFIETLSLQIIIEIDNYHKVEKFGVIDRLRNSGIL